MHGVDEAVWAEQVRAEEDQSAKDAPSALPGDPEVRYALAPDGVFWSIQGEGHLQGFQMAFVRLAGCSVGCAECDTDYGVAERVTLEQLVERVQAVMPVEDRDQFVWVTGGEPADLSQRKQVALIRALKARGWSVGVATSGAKRFIPPVDWLSVSPHSVDGAGFQQRYGNELKLVDGLGGIDGLDEWERAWGRRTDFLYRYAQPLTLPDGSESRESLERCLAFLRTHPGWGLSQQRHRSWGVR